MWTDDLDVIKSCDFYHFLLNFKSIDSIDDFAATYTFVYMKAPTSGLVDYLSNCVSLIHCTFLATNMLLPCYYRCLPAF